MFGQSPDPTLASRPSGSLGPRYKVVYIVPGPNDIPSRVVQFVYPYAKPVALTFMRPGQPFWEGETTHGGWFRASPGLKRMLVRAGLPASASS
jgi:NADPH-dependent 2,4-dienoyl-CoA reductase/sulfur reductase-like enzyme